MSDQHDPLSFLNGGGDTPAPEVVAEPVAEAAPETPAETPEPPAAEGQPRGPDGKFAPKAETPAPSAPEAAAPATPPAAEAPAAQPAEPPEGHVPAAAMHAERTARQALERELAELKAAKPEVPVVVAPVKLPPAPRPLIERPDAELEPEAARIFDVLQAQRWDELLETSGERAEKDYGTEAVKAAHAWGYQRAGSDPSFAQRIKASRHPYEFLVQEHQAAEADAVMRQALADPTARAKFLAILKGEETAATTEPAAATAPAIPLAPPAPPQTPVTPPPKSIVDATSAGGLAHVPSGPGQAYDAAFSKG